MNSKDKPDYQKELETFVADRNPMDLVIGTDTEYEDEIAMFLQRINHSMAEPELTEVLRQVFREMFSADQVDSVPADTFRLITQKYLSLLGRS